MKSIDKISMMSLEELETISNDTSIEVPEGLNKDIENVLEAESVYADSTRHSSTIPYAVIGTLGAAAASAAIVLSLNPQPKDTFDDPALAYAQLQETFSYINSKSTKALGLASESLEKIDEMTEIINSKF